MDPSMLMNLFQQFGPSVLSVLGGIDNSIQGTLSNIFNYAQGQANEADYRTMAGSQLPIYENLARGTMDTLTRNAQGAIDREAQIARDAVNMGRETRDRAVDNYRGLRGDVLGEAATNRDRVLQGYRDRYGRVMDYLKGAGEQERKDINQRFNNENSAATQRLVNSGFGNSSIAPTIRGGIERERSDSLGGLNERLRGQYIAADSSLSGDVLGADERLSGALNSLRYDTGAQGINLDTGLSGALQQLQQSALSGANRFGYAANNDLASNLFNFGTVPLNAQERFTNTGIGLRSDTQYQPPPPFNPTLAFTAGQGSVNAPNYPSSDWLSSLLGPVGQGAGAAIGTYTAKAFAGFCIDAEALIDTPKGQIPLKSIRPGDKVYGLDGREHSVLFVDCGKPHVSRHESYITIEFSDERALTLTDDHLIECDDESEKDIGVDDSVTTRRGQSLAIKRVTRANPVASGDLWVSGSAGYYANGIPVRSMLKQYGFALDDLRAGQEVA